MGFDWAILWGIQEHIANPTLDAIVPAFTTLGNQGLIWIVIGVIMGLVGITAAKDSPRRKLLTWAFLLCAAVALAAVFGELVLKHLVARPRPFVQDPTIELLIAAPHGYSFPSGHTFQGFAAATLLLCLDKRAGIPALVLAISLAFSRLYVFAHFPTDVLAGCLLGVAVGCLVAWSARKLGVIDQATASCVQ